MKIKKWMDKSDGRKYYNDMNRKSISNMLRFALYFIVAIFRLLTLTIRRERYEILMVDNIQIDDYLSLKSIIVIVTIPLHVG